MGYSMAMDGMQTYDAYHQRDKNEKVLEVLKGYLAGDELNTAMNLWERQYCHQPIEKLSFFIFELESTVDVRGARRELLKKLESELKHESNSSVKTESVVRKVRQRMQATSVKAKEEEQVIATEKLSAFCQALSNHLADVKSSERIEVCSEYLEETELPTFLREEVLAIVVEGAEPKHLVTDEDHVRDVINIVYTMLCEFFGPVKADKILAKAVSENDATFSNETITRFL